MYVIVIVESICKHETKHACNIYTQLLFFFCTQEINFTVKIACPNRNSRNLENMDSSDDDDAPKQRSHSSYSMGLYNIPITFYGCGVLHTTRMIVTCPKVCTKRHILCQAFKHPLVVLQGKQQPITQPIRGRLHELKHIWHYFVTLPEL